METITTPESTSPNRRRKTAKFALAGVAVVGIGAALTSAAWSDNVWFVGDTAAAEFELTGSVDNVNFFVADTEGLAIDLGDQLGAIGPDVSDSARAWVRNDGEIPIYLNDPVITISPDFVDGVDAPVWSYTRDVLQPGQSARVDVTLTGNDALDEGDTGTITILIVGDSDAP